MRKIKSSYWKAFGIGLGILCIGFLPWPYWVRTSCYIVPIEEWELIQVNPDKLLSRARQNLYFKTSKYTLLQFDRQDFVHFVPDSTIRFGQKVKKGQIIGKLVSSENQLVLSNFQGELKKAKANLALIQTGEKPAVREEAMAALEYAKAQHAAILPQLERKRKLFEQHLISQEEWELMDATEALLRQNVALQEARFKVVCSGEKAEMIRLLEADIDRLQDQLNVFQSKMALGEIRAPLEGIFSFSSDSVLCRIARMDSMVCIMAIRPERISLIHPGNRVYVWDSIVGQKHHGIIFAIDQKSVMVGTQMVFLATTGISNQNVRLSGGTIGRAWIVGKSMSLWERLDRWWRIHRGNMGF